MSPRFALSTLRAMTAICLSALLVGCLEKEGETRIKDVEDKMDGQRFDIARANEFLIVEKAKLAGFEQAALDLTEAKGLTESLSEMKAVLEAAQTRNSDLNDSIKLTELELSQYRNQYRKVVRKASVGTNIDLSTTKGDDFKDVRILSITPLDIRVYMPSGPQTVLLKDITPAVREMLQMGDDEAAGFIEKQNTNATLRAEKFKKWKEGQGEREEKAAKEAIIQKMRDMQEEVYKREDEINVRIQEIKGWKSKASNLEMRASQEKDDAKSRKAERYAELSRDKADALADQNSDSWIVVGRLKAELEDLKRMGIR
jgi:hypothetical protein